MAEALLEGFKDQYQLGPGLSFSPRLLPTGGPVGFEGPAEHLFLPLLGKQLGKPGNPGLSGPPFRGLVPQLCRSPRDTAAIPASPTTLSPPVLAFQGPWARECAGQAGPTRQLGGQGKGALQAARPQQGEQQRRRREEARPSRSGPALCPRPAPERHSWATR